MSRVIPISVGHYAIVDDSDYSVLNRLTWHLHPDGYARAFVGNKTLYMHRMITRAPQGIQVDHINRNRLDNRRENLRFVTDSQQSINRGKVMICKGRVATSKYKGVYWEKNSRKFRVRISFNGKRIQVGYFTSEVEAALAYNDAIQRFYGEYAALNQVAI